MLKSFGKLPSGKRLDRIESSPNYKDGAFQNIQPTEMLAKDVFYPKMMAEFFFGKVAGGTPSAPVPTIESDLKSLSLSDPVIVWFGHSSYLIIINGKRILVDPVFSAYASPWQFIGTKNFAYSHPYSIDDFSEIDLVLLTHDHYDHLDYHAILKLRSKTKQFCTALGVGAHLAHWGIEESKIHEFDWWESATFFSGLELTATPARHFSGRGFKRNQSLWTSFVLSVEGYKIFIGGDSGYDSSFKTIGDKLGPFDLAILECGQYNEQWPFIHMMPEHTVQAAMDLGANVLLPVHWGKFKLSLHSWTDPINRAVAQAKLMSQKITTPMIGEIVKLDTISSGSHWWK
jgi:L-ascorbate metabolism protein UlaG (beta-lactamase superfamily)